MNKLKRWNPRDPDFASHRNEAVDAINDNLPIVAGPGIGVSTGKAGTTVSAFGDFVGRGYTFGVLTSTGPDGDADYSDARYWVRLATPDATIENAAIDFNNVSISTNDIPDGESTVNTVTATNIAESASASHVLPTTEVQVVQLFRFADHQGVTHWFFNCGSADAGQFEGMVKIMVADNSPGWSFPFAVNPIS